MMMSYILRTFFGTMGSKHCNIDGKSVCAIQGGAMLKNKSRLVTFYKSILVSLWTFQPTLIHEIKTFILYLIYINLFVLYIYIYIYIYNTNEYIYIYIYI